DTVEEILFHRHRLQSPLLKEILFSCSVIIQLQVLALLIYSGSRSEMGLANLRNVISSVVGVVMVTNGTNSDDSLSQAPSELTIQEGQSTTPDCQQKCQHISNTASFLPNPKPDTMCSLLCLLIIMVLLPGAKAEDSVFQGRSELSVLEGQNITLDCKSSTAAFQTVFWYIQYPGQALRYLMKIYSSGNTDKSPDFSDRFSAALHKGNNTVPLNIARAVLSDSAVYFCAMEPTLVQMERTPHKNPRLGVPHKTPGQGSVSPTMGEGMEGVGEITEGKHVRCSCPRIPHGKTIRSLHRQSFQRNSPWKRERENKVKFD
ncbi:uncharacterized protein LOC144489293, partial [Mustelus asterias]